MHALIAANPFPGLRSLKPGEADRFFGRGQQVDELVARLAELPLLAVSGASGCCAAAAWSVPVSGSAPTGPRRPGCSCARPVPPKKAALPAWRASRRCRPTSPSVPPPRP